MKGENGAVIRMEWSDFSLSEEDCVRVYGLEMLSAPLLAFLKSLLVELF